MRAVAVSLCAPCVPVRVSRVVPADNPRRGDAPSQRDARVHRTAVLHHAALRQSLPRRLHRGWAHPSHLSRDSGSPLRHLRRDWTQGSSRCRCTKSSRRRRWLRSSLASSQSRVLRCVRVCVHSVLACVRLCLCLCLCVCVIRPCLRAFTWAGVAGQQEGKRRGPFGGGVRRERPTDCATAPLSAHAVRRAERAGARRGFPYDPHLVTPPSPRPPLFHRRSARVTGAPARTFPAHICTGTGPTPPTSAPGRARRHTPTGVLGRYNTVHADGLEALDPLVVLVLRVVNEGGAGPA